MPVDVFLIKMGDKVRQLVCEWDGESFVLSSPLWVDRGAQIPPDMGYAVSLPRSRPDE